jgi:hypothetical protein
MDNVRKRFFKLVDEKGLSLRQVAQEARQRGANIDAACLSRIVNGVYPSTWKNRKIVCDILGVTQEELFQLSLFDE